jgi:hypothetical protein
MVIAAGARHENGPGDIWAIKPAASERSKHLLGDDTRRGRPVGQAPWPAADALVGPAEDARNRPIHSVFNGALLPGSGPRSRTLSTGYPMLHTYVEHPIRRAATSDLCNSFTLSRKDSEPGQELH